MIALIIFREPVSLANYNATQQGQLDYLLRLKEIISNSGGSGLVYWEPAWFQPTVILCGGMVHIGKMLLFLTKIM